MHCALPQVRKGYTMLKSKLSNCLLALLLTSFAVTGCATATPEQTAVQKAIAATAPDFCATAKPIYIGKADVISDQTANEILAHNLTGRKLCGW